MNASRQQPQRSGGRNASPRDLLNAAIELHQAGRINRAEALYRQILSVAPKNADANHLLGLVERQKGRPEAAITHISRAIRQDPRNAIFHSNLGVTYMGMGRHADAAQSYKRAIALDPKMAALHNNLGVALQALERHEEAVKAFREALALQPAYPEARNNIGLSLIECAEAPGSADPKSETPEDTEARQAAARELVEEAEEHLREAIRLKPDYSRARMNLGRVLQIQKRFDEAADVYEDLLALGPDADTYTKLGIVRSLVGEFEDAVAAFNAALALDPGAADAHGNLGIALAEMGEYRRAAESYRKALEITPEDSEILQYFGHAMAQLGDTQAAADAYRAALKFDPDKANSLHALVRLKRYATPDADTEALEEAYARSEPGSETRMHLAFAMGKVYEDQRDYRKAFDYFLEGNALRRAGYDYATEDDIEKFNRIKSIFTAAFFEARKGVGHEDPTPVFILGMPRSGTTLTEQILASHPDVHGAGELGYVRHLAMDAGLIDENGFRAEEIAAFTPEDFARLGEDYVRKVRAQAPTARFITDKMPHNFLNIGLIRLALPNARIIHCRRNPADDCLSIFKNFFASDGHPYAYELAELGRYHNLYRDLMAHWHSVLPGVIHDIDYEATVADQEAQSRSLLEFCGLEWDEAVLSFHQTERRVKTASIGQVHQPIYATSVKLSARYGDVLDPLLAALAEYEGD